MKAELDARQKANEQAQLRRDIAAATDDSELKEPSVEFSSNDQRTSHVRDEPREPLQTPNTLEAPSASLIGPNFMVTRLR